MLFDFVTFAAVDKVFSLAINERPLYLTFHHERIVFPVLYLLYSLLYMITITGTERDVGPMSSSGTNMHTFLHRPIINFDHHIRCIGPQTQPRLHRPISIPHPGPKITEKRYWQLRRGAEVERRRRDNRAPRRWRVGRGTGYPLPTGEGSGEKALPLPRKKIDFASESGDF